MTTYTWNCKTVDAYPSYDELTDVVYNVHWILAGRAHRSGRHLLYLFVWHHHHQLEDLSPDTFVPVDQLTNEMVTGCGRERNGEEAVAEKKATIDAELESQINLRP